MSVASDLVEHLRNHPGLSALVADRIYPRRMPDDATLPCLVYNRISTVPDIGLASVDLSPARFQFDAWSDRSQVATDVGDQLEDALNLVAIPTSIDRVLPDGRRDRYDNQADLHGETLDFLVFA